MIGARCCTYKWVMSHVWLSQHVYWGHGMWHGTWRLTWHVTFNHSVNESTHFQWTSHMSRHVFTSRVHSFIHSFIHSCIHSFSEWVYAFSEWVTWDVTCLLIHPLIQWHYSVIHSSSEHVTCDITCPLIYSLIQWRSLLIESTHSVTHSVTLPIYSLIQRTRHMSRHVSTLHSLIQWIRLLIEYTQWMSLIRESTHSSTHSVTPLIHWLTQRIHHMSRHTCLLIHAHIQWMRCECITLWMRHSVTHSLTACECVWISVNTFTKMHLSHVTRVSSLDHSISEWDVNASHCDAFSDWVRMRLLWGGLG